MDINAPQQNENNTPAPAIPVNPVSPETEPPLTRGEKIWATTLVIFFTSIAFLVILAYWPDQLSGKLDQTTYIYKLFQVQLVKGNTAKLCCTIQLSTLLLILVAAAGFLGNMVYVGNSLSAFIGANKFKRSWVPWYFIKPFTASGLALFLYFAMNSTGAPKPVDNLFTIMTTATLAGLFTTIATQKLKEIFTAIFKPNDDLPNKLDGKKMTINTSAIHPDKLDVANPNTVLIPGENLDPNNLVVKVLGVEIPAPTITPALIKFVYKVADADKTKTVFDLVVTDKTGTILGQKQWGV